MVQLIEKNPYVGNVIALSGLPVASPLFKTQSSAEEIEGVWSRLCPNSYKRYVHEGIPLKNRCLDQVFAKAFQNDPEKILSFSREVRREELSSFQRVKKWVWVSCPETCLNYLLVAKNFGILRIAVSVIPIFICIKFSRPVVRLIDKISLKMAQESSDIMGRAQIKINTFIFKLGIRIGAIAGYLFGAEKDVVWKTCQLCLDSFQDRVEYWKTAYLEEHKPHAYRLWQEGTAALRK